MPFPPPPPPPPTSTQRLVKVVPRKTGHQPSFWQLDGEGGSEEDDDEDDDEDKEGMREVDGRVYCIFCNVLSQPKPVEPISFDSFDNNTNMKPMACIMCTSCKIKGTDVGVCLNCRRIAAFNLEEWDRTCRPCMFALLAEEALSPNCSHSCNTAV